MVHKKHNILLILLFVVIEEEVRNCLKQLHRGSGHKSAIIKSVMQSEEVEFYWLIAQADFDVGDEETYQLLLHKIVELYVTVWGFSYASNQMERYNKLWLKEHKKPKLYAESCMIMKIVNKHTYIAILLSI